MTATLLLLLKGPLQSWGSASRFTVRETGDYPTKSGVLGLLAAAQGRRRTDPVEDLARLRFAVRVDQPGVVSKDFQTAIDWRTNTSMPLVSRYYLADAVFVAAVEGPRPLLEGLSEAIQSPKYPLYLGRRSCPIASDLVLGIVETDAVTALHKEPWRAALHHRRQRGARIQLPIFRDAQPGERGIRVQDVPVSYSQEHRQYEWREVVQEFTPEFQNEDGRSSSDPFFEAVMTA